ncbi:MAG TPA: LysE family transporter [Burkholderiaceae bacterium]|nr:LysE family transporter [Rhodoferax sp.]HQX58693.1 LysE family transporter [Burkholderiaceae bacterium]HQZ04319.1 LysE family transporter [Burkholderiaceae bacterium]
MVDMVTLVAFTGAVLLLLLSPGPNMVFVLSHGAAYGIRGGMAAACGIAVADMVMTALVATGLGLVVRQWPQLLLVVRYAGAAYLLWMAAAVMHTRRKTLANAAVMARPRQVFVRAMANGLLNPKALIFFLTFLPAFVNPAHQNVAMQLWALGLWLTAVALLFHAALGFIGAHLRRAAAQASVGHAALQWLHAAVLAGLAAWVIFS